MIRHLIPLQLIFVARKGVWLRRNSFRVVLGVMRLSVALSALKTLPLMVSDTVDDDDIVCVCVCVCGRMNILQL